MMKCHRELWKYENPFIYSPDQSKVKRRAGKFLKSKCEISFSIRYLIFESYLAGEILKASKVAFKN